MLEEIAMTVVGSEPGLEVVETIRDADVVLLGSNDPALAVELLEEYPGVTVIAIAEEGQSGWLYAAGREPVSLGALSRSALVRAVRSSGVRKADGDRLDR
jgi:hypothetical protein